MKLHIKNIRVEYHRNGIMGAPFHVCLFDQHEPDEEPRRMVAILFDDSSYCAVLAIDKLAADNIKFGDNSWRGDVFEHQLREAIEKYQNS